MSGPPPPPPPSAPPPPLFSPTKGGGGSNPDDRSALLKSIRSGTKLKKTVTNDKSAPLISGKISNNNNSSNSSSVSSSSMGGGNTASSPNGMNLGGLFAGGMPKLRPTGKLGVSNLNNSNNLSSNGNVNNHNGNVKKKPDAPPQPVKAFNANVQNELKKQLASDNKNRGPPPPAPVRHITDENGMKSMPNTAKTLNGYRLNQTTNTTLQPNHSTLHRKTKSNANLSNLDSTDSINGFSNNQTPMKQVISYGKPNLAPKPPTLNGKPVAPPKKLIINGKPISRAHSMRSPRSPSPQSPDNPAIKFGTVKNLSSVIGQSLGHSTGNLSPRPRPMLNGRPSAPPPSVPNQAPPPPPHSPSPSPIGQTPPPPPSKSGVRPPNHAPPPPPPGVLPQPPNHAPPLPPHRSQPNRAPPAIPNMSAPPPPPRHSSMREANAIRKQAADFDEKFKHMFNSPNMFPKPPPYRHVIKLYTQRQAVSKQQAPLPPNMQHTPRTWDTTSTC